MSIAISNRSLRIPDGLKEALPASVRTKLSSDDDFVAWLGLALRSWCKKDQDTSMRVYFLMNELTAVLEEEFGADVQFNISYAKRKEPPVSSANLVTKAIDPTDGTGQHERDDVHMSDADSPLSEAQSMPSPSPEGSPVHLSRTVSDSSAKRKSTEDEDRDVGDAQLAQKRRPGLRLTVREQAPSTPSSQSKATVHKKKSPSTSLKSCSNTTRTAPVAAARLSKVRGPVPIGSPTPSRGAIDSDSNEDDDDDDDDQQPASQVASPSDSIGSTIHVHVAAESNTGAGDEENSAEADGGEDIDAVLTDETKESTVGSTSTASSPVPDAQAETMTAATQTAIDPEPNQTLQLGPDVDQPVTSAVVDNDPEDETSLISVSSKSKLAKEREKLEKLMHRAVKDGDGIERLKLFYTQRLDAGLSESDRRVMAKLPPNLARLAAAYKNYERMTNETVWSQLVQVYSAIALQEAHTQLKRACADKAGKERQLVVAHGETKGRYLRTGVNVSSLIWRWLLDTFFETGSYSHTDEEFRRKQSQVESALRFGRGFQSLRSKLGDGIFLLVEVNQVRGMIKNMTAAQWSDTVDSVADAAPQLKHIGQNLSNMFQSSVPNEEILDWAVQPNDALKYDQFVTRVRDEISQHFQQAKREHVAQDYNRVLEGKDNVFDIDKQFAE